MNPMMEIPVCLAGGKDQDEKTVIGRFRPDQIQGYYPGYNWGSVVIVANSSILTTLTCEELDQAMTQYRVLCESGKVRKVGGNLSIIKTAKDDTN